VKKENTMSFRFFDRVARLVRADAHGVVSVLEDRSLLLEQHLREAELAVAAKRAQDGALAEEDLRLRRALEAERRQASSLDEDAALALAGAKEELARFAVRRLLASRKRAAALETELARSAEERAALGERLASQERALEELRERVRGHRARTAARSAAQAEATGLPVCVADEEIELELLRRRGMTGGAA
jgi:phage shock protein A